MTSVLIYARSSVGKWWQHIAEEQTFAQKATILSDLPNEGDIHLMPYFYRYMNASDTSKWALDQLGVDLCDDIIARCRLLRNLERVLSLKMIGAMWQAIEQIVEQEQPGVVLSFIIDHYIVDILDRVVTRRGIRYLGVAHAVIPGYFMFTTRGELNQVRDPSVEEVDQAIRSILLPSFSAGVPKLTRPDYSRFATQFLYYYIRGKAFEVLRNMRRDRLNFHYLATREHVSDYRVRMKDLHISRFVHADWQQRLQVVSPEKRIFVGLQVNPEATIDYWVPDLELIDYHKSLLRFVDRVSNAGFTVFVKDHPVMFGHRRIELFEALEAFPNVVILPYTVSSQWMIENCKTTFTWTGTVGLQAAIAGKCAVVTSGAYYAQDGLFTLFNSLSDIDSLPERIDSFELPLDLHDTQRRLVSYVLSSCMPGVRTYRGFSPNDPTHIEKTQPLIESLNRYVPEFIKDYI
jgi:hypothetical protein